MLSQAAQRQTAILGYGLRQFSQRPWRQQPLSIPRPSRTSFVATLKHEQHRTFWSGFKASSNKAAGVESASKVKTIEVQSKRAAKPTSSIYSRFSVAFFNHWIWLTLKISAGFFIFLHAANIFISIKGTYGPSMLPALQWEGQWIIISRFFHRHGRNISVGDIISYESPVRSGTYAVKRVVGMPGDFVCRDTPGKGEGWLIQVPEGHCWIAGDNQDASRDSRNFGPLPLALVRGKVLAKYTVFPPMFHVFQNGLVEYEPTGEEHEGWNRGQQAQSNDEDETGLYAAVQKWLVRNG